MRKSNKTYPSDKKYYFSNEQKIIDFFIECLRKKCIKIDNMDLCLQWITQRIRKFKATIRPKAYIRSSYISNIFTREYQIGREYSSGLKRSEDES